MNTTKHRGTKRRGVVLALLGLVLAPGCGSDEAGDAGTADGGEAGRRPNIVLLVSDDHDYEHLGFMGAAPSPTPQLDELAAQGLVFTEGTSAPRCRPTLAGLLTGRWPHQNGVWSNASKRRLRARGQLPELLKQAGYACYAEGKYWEGSPRSSGFEFGPAESDVGANANGFVREGQAELFEFLEGVGERPFFVWWAPLLPHVPHNAPEHLLTQVDADAIEVPPWISADDREAFVAAERASLAMVRWLDQGVGELRDKLRELDLERDTLFVFLIDNGWANGLTSKGSPYEKGVHTPIVVSWPGRVEAARRGELVSYLDVMPTLLDYAGAPVPERLAGRSLRPLAEAGAGRAPDWRDTLCGAVYSAAASPQMQPELDLFAQHARDARWKYVRWVRSVEPGPSAQRLKTLDRFAPKWSRRAGQEELFDLAADPYERVDLAGDPAQAERLAAFREGVDQWWTETGGGPLPD